MTTDLIEYQVTIRHARNQHSEPLFRYPFLAQTIEDFERGVGEAFYHWKQTRSGEYPLEDGYTVIVEKRNL